MNSFSKYLFEHLHFGLEEKDFTLIEKIIFFLIILNCVFVVIESEKLIYEQYNQLFDSAKLFFGIVFLNHQFGSFLGAYLGGYFYDNFGSFNYAWYLAIVLSFIASLIHLPIDERPIEQKLSTS